MKKINIALVGLGQIGNYLLNELNKKKRDIEIKTEVDRLRPIDADYQMFDNTKIRSVIDWKPEIPTSKMFRDLLNHWRKQIEGGRVPLSR